ncbi:PepSY domain-containing protein [Steroidobacter sp.]|uniref:PepSY domain-containing protein n=1 Tax=Steroidobacter sp. TaxID=1978227 RepID=UPI001A4ACDF0|nr:PepSY domain-containing protein [Steroidobacter sp.]MBL8267212.1 hypothetical protein [Steroidobacter sp.]
MKPVFLSRTLHKWLALFVGLQLVLWTVSGFYMVVVDLDFIHGDSLVHNLRSPIPVEEAKVTFTEIVRQHPAATQVSLKSLPTLHAPVYEITEAAGKVLIDAASGQRISPLNENLVLSLASAYYAGQGKIATTKFLERDAPSEIQTRPLPLWQVNFDDWLETTLYIHPDTGALVTRRHRFWRWFDFLWMFHIMDYDTRSDMNNGLLRASTILGTVTVLSGGWLLYFSFRRRRAAVA